MLRFYSLSKFVHARLQSAVKKNTRNIVALRSGSTKKLTVAHNIFVNQYIRSCSTLKGASDDLTSQHKQSFDDQRLVQKFEPIPAPAGEFIQYHTLYKLINNIEKDQSAICLGKIADESGLVDENSHEDLEEALEDVRAVDPHYTAIRSAITKAYNSSGFAFNLGSSGLYGFSLQIRAADGELVDCGTIDRHGLGDRTLKEHCKPAPYGDLKTTSTKVDPEVRSAWTIDYGKIVITKDKEETNQSTKKKATKKDPHYKKALQNLLSRVQEEFQDDTLYLEPYKLNMYEKGGFFKPHVDTPRYENMVGTLVVTLADAEGGDLIIRHGDETFKAKGGATAFFCDREHEVTPVTDEYESRVTLTFNICKDNPSVKKTKQAITLKRTTPLPTDRNVASLIKAIKESPFKKVGLLTEFDYTQKGISLQSLKGSDRTLLEELSKEPSFKIDLLPTVVSLHYDDNTGLDDYPEVYNIQGNVYRFSNEDLERMMRGEIAPKIAKEDEAVFFRVKDGLEVYKHEQKSAERTGNEALEHTIDNIYFNGAIVVTDLNPKSTPTATKKK